MLSNIYKWNNCGWSFIRVDFDRGFQDIKQWAHGRSGGQVNFSCFFVATSTARVLISSLFSLFQVGDEYCTYYYPDILVIILLLFSEIICNMFNLLNPITSRRRAVRHNLVTLKTSRVEMLWLLNKLQVFHFVSFK